MKAVIIENLSKRYPIDPYRANNMTLRDMATDFVKNRIRIHSGTGNLDFWALKNINFSVKFGEVLGIIGANGAGKSTLLKIISKITPPSRGRILISGRTASLLEVGTGFHPELTGRENIYINGAILGMKKAEIKSKFDEVVEFSGVEKFIDVPVKRYSSGMQVRLAFSVAAHLDTDIIIIDEVLAVGDLNFQKKCLNKLGNIVNSKNRTVIFVSHNLGAVNTLCAKCVYLKNGKVNFMGDSHTAINRYIQDNSKEPIDNKEKKDMKVVINNIVVLDDNKKSSSVLDASKAFSIKVNYELKEDLKQKNLTLLKFYDENRNFLFATYDTDTNPQYIKKRKKGRYRSIFYFPSRIFNLNGYWFTVSCGVPSEYGGKEGYYDTESNNYINFYNNKIDNLYGEKRNSPMLMEIKSVIEKYD